MVGRTKPTTKAQKRRLEILSREVGCIACHKDGHEGVPAQIHHILHAGNRMGHDYTIPLCPTHHAAVNTPGFKVQYGKDIDLLPEANDLLADFESRTIGGPA